MSVVACCAACCCYAPIVAVHAIGTDGLVSSRRARSLCVPCAPPLWQGTAPMFAPQLTRGPLLRQTSYVPLLIVPLPTPPSTTTGTRPVHVQTRAFSLLSSSAAPWPAGGVFSGVSFRYVLACCCWCNGMALRVCDVPSLRICFANRRVGHL